jgi:hypothetical protein
MFQQDNPRHDDMQMVTLSFAQMQNLVVGKKYRVICSIASP